MRKLSKLGNKLNNFSIKNLTLYIVAGQVTVFMLNLLKIISVEKIVLIGSSIRGGEYWRLITFVFIPSTFSPIWLFFALYIFYLYGTALEDVWGTLKYNLYLLIGIISSIITSFIFPNLVITNIYIYLSMMYAFAFLFPDFELYLFFILPIKIKWLALISAGFQFYHLVVAPMPIKILIIISFLNFFIFFMKDIFLLIKNSKRRVEKKVVKIELKRKPNHICIRCSKDDIKNPQLSFRYDDNDECICIDCLEKGRENSLSD